MGFIRKRLMLVVVVLCVQFGTLLGVTFDNAFEIVTQRADGYLAFNPIAQQHLSSFGDKKMAVVAVVGPYRSGKSYLLNQLIDLEGRARSFSIANSVQPHTHGIFSYMYEPQPPQGVDADEQPEVVMFADTTGLFAPSNSEQADARIVALASLISSVLIYNNLHVVDAQELNRFNFIVQYARGVPKSQEIGDWKNFQADLMWVVRDFFLELKDKEQRDINATQWLFNALDEASSSDLRTMFRSVTAFTLPVPMRDRDKLVHLEDHPRDRTPAFKTALAHFRSQLLETVRSKRIGQAHMTGSDLIHLIETCIDRLNSDRGIQSINTMETLVAAINEQVLQKAMDRYEKQLNQTEFPIKEEELIHIHQSAIKEQIRRLKKELYSLSTEQRDINAKTLKTRVKRTFQSFVNLNNVKCTNLVNQVIENEASSAMHAWNEESQMPLDDAEIQKQHLARRKESEVTFEEKVVARCLSKNIDSAKQNLISRLDSVLNDVLALNHRIAEAICKEKTESWRVLIDGRLDGYNTLMDIERDFVLMKNDLKTFCKGAASSKIEPVDKTNRLKYVENMIQLSRQRWKRTFFVLCIICCVFGGLGVQTADMRFAISVAAMLLSWLVVFLAHPIVRGFSLWDHIDAIFSNCTNVFSQILAATAIYPTVTAVIILVSAIAGGVAYKRRRSHSKGKPPQQYRPAHASQSERSVQRYPHNPDLSFGMARRPNASRLGGQTFSM